MNAPLHPIVVCTLGTTNLPVLTKSYPLCTQQSSRLAQGRDCHWLGGGGLGGGGLGDGGGGEGEGGGGLGGGGEGGGGEGLQTTCELLQWLSASTTQAVGR